MHTPDISAFREKRPVAKAAPPVPELPFPTGTRMSHGPSQRILENLTTAVLTFDGELRLTSINPAGEILFEISSKKVVGQPLAGLLPHSQRLVRTLRQTLESRHPFTARGVRLVLPGAR